MIPAQHRIFEILFFSMYFRWIARKQFIQQRWITTSLDPNASVLLISNHQSWWDGILLFLINKRYWKKKFHVMMLEEELKKRMFLSRLGAFSVHKKSSSVGTSLEYAEKILEDPNNLVLIFPQGRIESPFSTQFTWPKGVQTLAKSTTCKSIVFWNFFYLPTKHQKFEVHGISRVFQSNEKLPEETDWKEFLLECRKKQSEEWA
jgi:1-acyl-sn-glycerol-3-phosphate acyltransferase